MRCRALLYHDVVDEGSGLASGFPGADAELYKLGRAEFAEHLSAIATLNCRPLSVLDAIAGEEQDAVVLTFDDGGSSALHPIADLLDACGWIGHFFITSNFIANKGFLSESEVRELRKRGHIVGSHSCSHPARFAKCQFSRMEQEWHDSCDRLADILGEAVTIASVPGGYYSRAAAEAAAFAGIRVLFNSEPVSSLSWVGDCAVIGRYSIQRGTSADVAAALAQGSIYPRAKQFAYWNIKKAAKSLGGSHWLRFRKYLLERTAKSAGQSSREQ